MFLIIFISNGSLNFRALFMSIFSPFPETEKSPNKIKVNLSLMIFCLVLKKSHNYLHLVKCTTLKGYNLINLDTTHTIYQHIFSFPLESSLVPLPSQSCSPNIITFPLPCLIFKHICFA